MGNRRSHFFRGFSMASTVLRNYEDTSSSSTSSDFVFWEDDEIEDEEIEDEDIEKKETEEDY